MVGHSHEVGNQQKIKLPHERASRVKIKRPRTVGQYILGRLLLRKLAGMVDRAIDNRVYKQQ
jgi:hypothetical protein